MPRYVIERDFGSVGDDEMQEIAARYRSKGTTGFPDIVWDHSHVCIDDDGAMKSFCVYSAPNLERLQEHADWISEDEVNTIHEIVGEITPEQVTV